MVKYTISGFADEISDDLNTQLLVHKNLGFKRIELRKTGGKEITELSGAEVAETFRLLHVHKIRPYSIGSPIGKISLDDDLDAHFELARRVCHITHVLGGKIVRVFSFYPRKNKPFDSADKDIIVDFLKRLAAIAHFYRITICLESGKDTYGESPEKVRELLDLVNMDKLRCAFDMANFAACGHDPMEAFELLRDYIMYFHIRDVDENGDSVRLGDGIAKIPEILKAYHAYKDDGEIFLALEPKMSAADDPTGEYIAAAEKLKLITENIK